MKSFAVLPFLASLATAHFDIQFPEWRGSSYTIPGADQYLYPCANVSQTNANRTLWPLDGGAVKLALGHKWTYFAINLGVGDVVSRFNVSLTPELHNATGNGTLCIPKLSVPAGLAQEGTKASLQVVTFGESGSALYNCADITFSAAAVNPECVNNGVSVAVVNPASASSPAATVTVTAAASTPTSGAAETFDNPLFGVAGSLAAMIAIGLSALL